MKFVSWNVNGFRAIIKKEAFNWIEQENPDVLCFQEIKADLDQVLPIPAIFKNYPYYYWNSSKSKKGYSGVAIFSKIEPVNITYGIGIDEFDKEGRVIEAEYNNYILFNIYFPNSGMEGRMDIKLRFNKAIENRINDLLKLKKNVIVTGDYNVAHKDIDIARPKENQQAPGFTKEEKEWMDDLLDSSKNNMIDTFRYFHKNEVNRYSWWNMRFGARGRNIGWRIDYFTINKALESDLKDADIYDQVLGSDHAPIMLELK